MANTNILKTLVEPYVRRWCSGKHGIEFEDREKEVRLVTGAFHRFDVVSKDGSIVAGIKTSTLRKNASKRPVGVGVIKSTFTELYFLSLTKAKKKLMILTDRDFCDYFRKSSRGKIAKGIEIIHCPLPKDLENSIHVVHENCRKEIGKK